MAKKDDNEEPAIGAQISTKDAISGAEGAAVQPASSPGRVRAFMLAKFPNREWADAAETDDGVADWMEAADKSLEEYRAADETILRVGAEYPELLAIAEDLAKDPNLPLGVAIRRNIDEEELEVGVNDPGYEELCRNRAERSERTKAKEAYQQRLDKNLEESNKTVRQYLTDNEMSEGEAAALGKYVDGIMDDYLDGRVTADVLNMFRNAMNYQKDVNDARAVGKTEGMNAKIDAERQYKQTATDGLPGPGSSTGQLMPPTAQRRKVIDPAKLLGLTEEELEVRRQAMGQK